MGAIALIAPVAVVTVIEHIGHLLAVGEIVDKDSRPLLPRSLAGDGLSTMLSGFLGGPPTTTYAENIGGMSVTRGYSTQIVWYAGGVALIVGGLCRKLAALIDAIPSAVRGGGGLLVFGLVASNGLRMLVSNGVDFDVNRNLMIPSVVIILGVGMETSGIAIPLADYTLPGMATSTLVLILLTLVLPQESKGPKLAALINSIPSPVMGGVCLLLFGLIASNGLRMLVSNGVDFDVNRNLMIASVVIILGVGMETSGIAIPLGDYTLPGMATSTLVGIILNLVLPQEKKGEARA